MERLAQLEKLKDHPRPELFSMLYTRHSDKTANGLTKAVIRWIEIHGGQAERISVQGTYVKGKTVNKGFYGATQIQGKYIPSQMVKGASDISAIIKSNKGTIIPWKIEIKIGKDKQSDNQKKYQETIEKSGGVYDIVRSLDEFVEKYNCLIENK